jgi:hypothetical protein
MPAMSSAPTPTETNDRQSGPVPMMPETRPSQSRSHLTRRVATAVLAIIGGGAVLSALVNRELSRRTVEQLAGKESVSLAAILAYEIARGYELTDERGLTGFIAGVRHR